jgi:uncharacterized protein (DUF1800 family)
LVIICKFDHKILPMASLNAHTQPLGIKNARHLLRRCTFNYKSTLISQFSQLTPAAALDLLFSQQTPTLFAPYDPWPSGSADGFWVTSANPPASFDGQERKLNITAGWWWYNAINNSTLQYKLSHFLSTRFTVEKINAGTASDFYDHLRLLLFYSYGNYKTLAKKMTLNNSMLHYLNNDDNNKTAPNENYAREFLELFTIGKGAPISTGNYTNYTEQDIVQAAKVLTGFKVQADRQLIDPDTGIPRGYNSFDDHETSNKTFSAAFGNTTITGAADASGMDTELSDYIEMVFAQQATAKNICRKLYSYFVKSKISEEVENDIILPLAEQLFANGYELKPVLWRLLESTHFYDLDDTNATDETIGAMIKSPIQQLSEIVTFLYARLPDPNIDPESFYLTFWQNFAHEVFLKRANMLPFDPENVAGHPAYHQSPDYDRNWVSASSLIARYKLSESLFDGKNKISGNEDIIAQIIIAQALEDNNIVSDPANPVALTTELCNSLFGQETDEARINYFMNTFLLQGNPQVDWVNLWGYYIGAGFETVVNLRLKDLITNILKAPESQMF